MYDPFAFAQNSGLVTWSWEKEMPDHLLGLSEGSHVYLNARQLTTQAEKRCTMAHELVHIMWNHDGRQPGAVERRVREQAAVQLITDHELLSALAWSDDLYVLAEELQVTTAVMRDRLEVYRRTLAPSAACGSIAGLARTEYETPA